MLTERDAFLHFFSKWDYYRWKFKSYFDFRLEENKLYQGYVTSNFSSSDIYNVRLRNQQVLSYLESRISLDVFWKTREIVNMLDTAVTIAYWWDGNYYRIYFQPNYRVLEFLWISWVLSEIHMIWVDLDSFQFKKYEYVVSSSLNDVFASFQIDISQVKFVLKMTHQKWREKFYIRLLWWLQYSWQSLFKNFIFWTENFLFTEIYINYIAFDTLTWSKQIYFTDFNNSLISNLH